MGKITKIEPIFQIVPIFLKLSHLGQMSQFGQRWMNNMPNCPPGNLVFDPSRAMCQYPHACNLHPAQLAPSVGHVLPPPQPLPAPVDFHCGTRRNGYYVRTPCASEFYACLGKRAIKMACPGRLVFDTRTMSCQYPEVCAQRGGGR